MKTYHTPKVLTLLFAVAASAFAQAKEVQINAKVISVPLDAAALRDAGLALESTAAMSNLGIIPADKAAAMLAKLEKISGHALMYSPSFVTRSGVRSTSESIREFIYPTEFVPAKISSEAGSKPVQIAPGQVIAATPSTPRSFEMRHTGFRLEVEPVINSDGTLIEMNLAPELVAFEGFINYSSPVKAVAADKEGKLSEVVLTENHVLQPVFCVVKSTIGVSMPSGHVLVLGGASGGSLPSAATKPDLTRQAKLDGKPTQAVFFFIQVKAFTP
ncbi:hypothetical protein [Prosthecobacter sp.]|uniref:hypothetical protein n=1 Tax=Prosthecobacter sp. TaxID=1965333 RepID=UPI0037841812